MESLLVFDLMGPMGHFRKFDTNSSSLTYSFPPRTVIAGIIAGILGMDKDSYYEIFSSEHCNIALSIRSQQRKITQTVNYMFMTSKTHTNNSQGHTQIPVEFLLPGGDVDHDKLCFRVYFHHTDVEIQHEVKERIRRNEFIYPPYLGITEMLGELKWVAEIQSDHLKQFESQERISIHSVCPITLLEERSLSFSTEGRESLTYQKERMTRDFYHDRSIKETETYLYEKSGLISAKVKGPVINIKYGKWDENIVFM